MGTLFHFSNELNNYKTNSKDNTNNDGYTRNINTQGQTSRDDTTYKQHINNNSKIGNNIKEKNIKVCYYKNISINNNIHLIIYALILVIIVKIIGFL